VRRIRRLTHNNSYGTELGEKGQNYSTEGKNVDIFIITGMTQQCIKYTADVCNPVVSPTAGIQKMYRKS
jgi:hypothetical protein